MDDALSSVFDTALQSFERVEGRVSKKSEWLHRQEQLEDIKVIRSSQAEVPATTAPPNNKGVKDRSTGPLLGLASTYSGPER